jgi:hypothetical protein
MRYARYLLGLIVVAGACVGIMVWRPWAKSSDRAGAGGPKVEYAALIRLPKQPPFFDTATSARQYDAWKNAVTAQFEAGKGALRQKQFQAATAAFQRARALAAGEQGRFYPSVEWYKARASWQVILTLRLAAVAGVQGNKAEAERLRTEAASFEAASKEAKATSARFEEDASWPTLKREWLAHKDPVLRLLGMHAAGIGAVNNQPGSDRDEIVAALKNSAGKDEAPQLREWAKLYVQWLEGGQ